jgi:hypothetical protein
MSPIANVLSKSAGSVALKVTIIVAAAIGGAGLVSSNVFAALTATASNTTGGSVTTGTLSLTLAPSSVSGITGGFTSAITAMGPGDTVNRYIDLTNAGTLDGASPTLLISTVDSNTIVNNVTTGLQVTLFTCSVAWTNTGTCSGTTTVAMSATSVAVLKSGAQTITLPTVLAGGLNRLKASISLPAGSENTINGVLPVNTVQGLTAALTWQFTVTERSAVTTNS